MSARNIICCSDNHGDAIDCSLRSRICRFRGLASHSLLLCYRMPISTTVVRVEWIRNKDNQVIEGFGSKIFDWLLPHGSHRTFVSYSNYDSYCEPISHVTITPDSNWRPLLFRRGVGAHAIKYTLLRRKHGRSPIGSGKRHLD